MTDFNKHEENIIQMLSKYFIIITHPEQHLEYGIKEYFRN